MHAYDGSPGGETITALCGKRVSRKRALSSGAWKPEAFECAGCRAIMIERAREQKEREQAERAAAIEANKARHPLEEHYGKFARDLASSFIAHRQGLTAAYARKRYCSDVAPVGEFWLELAQHVEKVQLESMDRQFTPPSPKAIQ
jgi:hypothetical protein